MTASSDDDDWSALVVAFCWVASWPSRPELALKRSDVTIAPLAQLFILFFFIVLSVFISGSIPAPFSRHDGPFRRRPCLGMLAPIQRNTYSGIARRCPGLAHAGLDGLSTHFGGFRGVARRQLRSSGGTISTTKIEPPLDETSRCRTPAPWSIKSYDPAYSR